MKAELGKRVAGALYVHRSAIALAPIGIVQAVSRASAASENFEWNVVRISKGSVTFLLYESFDEAAFPALLESIKVSEDRRDSDANRLPEARQSADPASQGAAPAPRRSAPATVSRAHRSRRGARVVHRQPQDRYARGLAARGSPRLALALRRT